MEFFFILPGTQLRLITNTVAKRAIRPCFTFV